MRLKLKQGNPGQRIRKSAAQRALGRWHPRAMHILAPQTDWRWALLETLMVMALATGLSAWLHPQDPLWTTQGFAWMWLVVAAMALRYGSAHAVVGMSIALLLWLALDRWNAPLGEFPRLNFIGALILTLICGEFSDRWNARLHDAQSVNAYIDERLQTLTQHHFLLSVSHDRLEQELLSRPFTLREILYELRQRVHQRIPDETTQSATPLLASEWLMQLLAQTCRLESAALFAIEGQKLNEHAVAKLGAFAPPENNALDSADPMLLMALQSGELTHVQSAPFIDSDRPSRYLVCAPIVSGSGRMLGVLVIERMAFTSLTLETLQFLSVLLTYYGDSLDFTGATAPLLAAYPECPPDFAMEAVRLQRLRDTAFIPSCFVAFTLPSSMAAAETWISRFDLLRRTLDVAWTHTGPKVQTHLVLLPLTDEQGMAGYLERVASSMREQFGASLSELAVRTRELDETVLTEQLQELLAASAAESTDAARATTQQAVHA